MVNIILSITEEINNYNNNLISAEECIHRIMIILGMTT